MAGMGGYGGMPFTMGGYVSHLEIVHQHLLEAYAANLSSEPTSLQESEAYAEAGIIATIFDAAERCKVQLQPGKMTDWLPDWEDATGTVDNPRLTLSRRRANLEGTFLGYGGNSDRDVEAVLRKTLGVAFVSLHTLNNNDPSAVVFMPGVNPGPPGMEYSSNTAVYYIRVTRAGTSDADFRDRIVESTRILDRILPTKMSFTFFIWDTDDLGDEGFVLDVSLLDEVAL